MLLKHVQLNGYAVHNKPTGRHNEQRFAKIRIKNIHQISLCSECQRKELNHHTIRINSDSKAIEDHQQYLVYYISLFH